MASLVDRLGGPAGLEQLIHDAYERVLANPELKPFFENADTQKIKRMQHVFLEAALTDETTMQDTGISIRAAHHGRNITRHHFALFVNCFLEAMEATGSVSDGDIDQVIGRLNTFADEVTETTSFDG